ncbi:hypothetical protein D9M68_42460 [compost metagenome]
MTLLTAAQRQILEDIASRKTTWWQEVPDVFGDHQMLYEAGLIAGANASADDGFGLLDMRLTMAGQQALASAPVKADAAPVTVRASHDVVDVPVVRPLWKRWSFWQTVFQSIGGFIGFVITVWGFWKALG